MSQEVTSAGGLSRASQRRQKKKARLQAPNVADAVAPPPPVAAQPPAKEDGLAPDAAFSLKRFSPPTKADAAVPATTAASSSLKPCTHTPATSSAVTPTADSGTSAFLEWSIPMPPIGSELHDSVQLALSQAETIVGRKYRYGATLMAGEDHIPIKSGSNKKPFQRDNIHAEASVLKGCPRAQGKDMMIGRLAPSRAASGGKRKGGSKKGDDVDDSDDDDDGGPGDDDDGVHYEPALGLRAAAPVTSAGKILNARPCAKCEAKMVARGVRRCYFTLNRDRIGVLEYNADPTG